MKIVIWAVRSSFAFTIILIVILSSLWLGLDLFNAIDDAFVEGLLLQGGVSAFLVSLLWFTLNVDWIVLLLISAGSIVVGLLGGRMVNRLIGSLLVRLRKPSPRVLAGCFGTTSIVIAFYLANALSVDEAELTDLQEGLVGIASIAFPLFSLFALVSLLATKSGRDPASASAKGATLRSAAFATIVTAWVIPVTPGDPVWQSGAAGYKLEAMGAKVVSKGMQMGKHRAARLVKETMEQGTRAARKLAVDQGRRVGRHVVEAGTGARKAGIRAARAIGIRNNATLGLRRHEIAADELRRRYPKAEIISEAMLRDAKGNVVRTSTGGRRLDLVAVENGRVVKRIEVTSPSRDKFAQLTREERVRDAGGTFVRGRNGRLYDIREGTDDVWRVDVDSGRVVADAIPFSGGRPGLQ